VGFTSGPKVAHFDRVEWLKLDPFSATAALSRGEVDWWELPPRDLVEQVSRDRYLTVVSPLCCTDQQPGEVSPPHAFS